jgi:hypothetical protein
MARALEEREVALDREGDVGAHDACLNWLGVQVLDHAYLRGCKALIFWIEAAIPWNWIWEGE